MRDPQPEPTSTGDRERASPENELPQDAHCSSGILEWTLASCRDGASSPKAQQSLFYHLQRSAGAA